jgi:hypothetical protein
MICKKQIDVVRLYDAINQVMANISRQDDKSVIDDVLSMMKESEKFIPELVADNQKAREVLEILWKHYHR